MQNGVQQRIVRMQRTDWDTLVWDEFGPAQLGEGANTSAKPKFSSHSPMPNAWPVLTAGQN
jgi:hypothetical protein